MMRKGLSPVVAIILLVFMTVAAAGGAFTFLRQTQEGFKRETIQTVETKVRIIDLDCNGTWVNSTLKNSGNARLDLREVDLFIRERASGNLNTTLSRPGLNLSANETSGSIEEPGGVGRYATDLSAPFQSGRDYEIQYSFVNNGGVSAFGICTAG